MAKLKLFKYYFPQITIFHPENKEDGLYIKCFHEPIILKRFYKKLLTEDQCFLGADQLISQYLDQFD